MALVLDATVSGANANAYVTRAEADAYFEGRMSAAIWTAAASADKDKALVNAASRLDHEVYTGVPATTTQRLQWPRLRVIDESGNSVLSTVIPRRIREAACELALVLLGTTDIQGLNQNADYESIQVGEIQIGFRPGAGNKMPDEVLRLIAPFRQSPNELRLKRG